MRTMLGLVMGLAVIAGAALARQPSAVIRHLGSVVPTPVPPPEAEERIRLITSFTLQNKPDGTSVITFEATDFGKAAIKESDKFRYRILATELYTLVEPKPGARALRDRIMRGIRDLEDDLLEFVEITGPPRVRRPLTSPR